MSYYTKTRSLTYSYLISMPLLLVYEVLIYITQPDPATAIRLSADIWLKSIFAFTGQNTFVITILVALVLGIYVFYRERYKRHSFHGNYFLGMILESLAYAVILASLISGFVTWLFAFVQSSGSVPTGLQQFTLSLGSGLYEELVFRVILVGALLWLFERLQIKAGARKTGAIIIGALIFSAVHYMGALGDVFTLTSFTFRFLFGVALNLVLIYRGFGIAAWTHSLYNLMLLFVWN
ncbi:MAG: CPBP family glutamic-type intramembrane protease [Balneolales bacterium]